MRRPGRPAPARSPGNDLTVRGPRSARAILKLRPQRAGHLPGPHGPRTGGGCGRPVLEALIRRLAADKPATRVPSAQECRFCDISALECPEPVESNAEPRRRSYHRLLISSPGVIAGRRDTWDNSRCLRGTQEHFLHAANANGTPNVSI